MKQVGSEEARRGFRDLLDEAQRGESAEISRNGKVIAVLIPAALNRIGGTPPAQADLTALGEEIATKWERAAIRALQELARDWPESITLISMDGGLSAVRTDLYHRGHDSSPGRVQHQEACVLANIDGIPNDGGGW